MAEWRQVAEQWTTHVFLGLVFVKQELQPRFIPLEGDLQSWLDKAPEAIDTALACALFTIAPSSTLPLLHLIRACVTPPTHTPTLSQ
jgi:hypothetical protein